MLISAAANRQRYVIEKMINDSEKVNDKMKFFKKMMDFGERDFKLLFWFFGLLTIPIFAYLYTLPFSFLVWLISESFGFSEKIIETLTKFTVIVCFVFAIGTQFYIWKIYKNKRFSKENPFT
jgi:hypothetical protein